MTFLSVAEMAADTLDRCDETLTELHEQCCEPNRSPRMLALADTLVSVRSGLAEMEIRPELADAVIAQIEEAGAEIGRLQIACCAPARMPLYADLLAGLSRTQRTITSARGGMEH